MDLKLKKFLKKLNLDDDEINNLTTVCSGLEITSEGRAKENVIILIDSGFPLCDVSFVVCANPAFLCNDPIDTKSSIESIDGDVEQAIKNDPYIL